MLKMHRDNRGIAATAVIIAVIVIAAIGGVAWMMMNKKSSSPTDSAANSTPEAVAARNECQTALEDEDFCKFATNFNDLGDYKATFTSSGKQTGTFQMEVDASGNSSLTGEDGGQETAIIYLNGASYIKDTANGTWFKYSSAAGDDSLNIKEDVNIDFDQSDLPEDQRVTYQRIGEEACGDRTCLKYQVKDPATAGSEQFVWFDTQDFQLRRWVMTEDGTTTDMSITYGDVTISEPSPVTDINL